MQTHTKLVIVLTIIVISFLSFSELLGNVVLVLGVGILERVVEKKKQPNRDLFHKGQAFCIYFMCFVVFIVCNSNMHMT